MYAEERRNIYIWNVSVLKSLWTDKCVFFIAISLIDRYNQFIIILYCIVSVFDNGYSLLEYSISYRFCKIPVKTGTCKKENDLKLKVIISIRDIEHCALCLFLLLFLQLIRLENMVKLLVEHTISANGKNKKGG